MAYGANNHGSMVQIGEDWYIFYHRHTNGSWYSRQGCAELLEIDDKGNVKQAEITSCGLNGGPLRGEGEYPAYLACHLYTDKESVYVGGDEFPKVMQDGRDGDEEIGYIGNIQNSATAGFKYFDIQGVRRIRITTRGYADGDIEVRNEIDGEVLAKLHIVYTNVWEDYETEISIPDGVQPLYFTFRGQGNASLKSFALLKEA